MKTYVLDTNVLLSDVNAITSFDDNVVVIPLAVLEELDRQKTRQDEVGSNARQVARKLDKLRTEGHLVDGVKLPNGGTIRVVSIQENSIAQLPVELRNAKVDNYLIAYMLQLIGEGGRDAVLVSKDINVRVKCDSLGIACEDYLKLRITPDGNNFYAGVQVVETTSSVIDEFYMAHQLEEPAECFDGDIKLYPNQIIVMKHSSKSRGIPSALARYDGSKLVELNKYDEVFGLKPRNKEQNFALNLLMDDTVKLVTLVGNAGVGKTLITLAAGCEQLIGLGKEQKYNKLIVSRPVMPVGKDIGFLPGTLEEKMEPWIAPIRDNLNFLMGDKRGKTGKKQSDTAGAYLQLLQEKGHIEVEAITYIRGRSIQDAFIVIDEAQNLSFHELKTIITRVGDGTKIVLLGDLEQIDNVHVDMYTNGLTYAIEKFKDHRIAGHITLLKGERSALATLAAEIL